MELKQSFELSVPATAGLLIVPYGIETKNTVQ